MIYFIQAGVTHGPVKIGFVEDDTDVETRRRKLQVGNAERLYIVATMPGDRDREHRLHKRFAEGRITGEWFDPRTPGLQDLISDAIHLEGFPDDRQSPASQAVLSC